MCLTFFSLGLSFPQSRSGRLPQLLRLNDDLALAGHHLRATKNDQGERRQAPERPIVRGPDDQGVPQVRVSLPRGDEGIPNGGKGDQEAAKTVHHQCDLHNRRQSVPRVGEPPCRCQARACCQQEGDEHRDGPRDRSNLQGVKGSKHQPRRLLQSAEGFLQEEKNKGANCRRGERRETEEGRNRLEARVICENGATGGRAAAIAARAPANRERHCHARRNGPSEEKCTGTLRKS